MFKHGAICLLLILSGCATHITKVNVPEIEQSSKYQLQDLRPNSEKQSEIFGLFILSDSYGLYRVADDAISPPAIRILQHRAFEKFKGSNDAPAKVLHLVIYKNLQSSLRLGAVSGALGYLLFSDGDKVSQSGAKTSLVDPAVFSSMAGAQEYQRALYTKDDAVSQNGSLTIFINTEIANKRVFTRTLVPLQQNKDEGYILEILNDAIKSHLSYY